MTGPTGPLAEDVVAAIRAIRAAGPPGLNGPDVQRAAGIDHRRYRLVIHALREADLVRWSTPTRTYVARPPAPGASVPIAQLHAAIRHAKEQHA